MAGTPNAENRVGDPLLTIDATKIDNPVGPYDIVRKMRASVCILGPLLARCGRVEVSMPGGCAIGDRPIDLHLLGLRQLGAQIHLKSGYVIAEAPRASKGRVSFWAVRSARRSSARPMC